MHTFLKAADAFAEPAHYLLDFASAKEENDDAKNYQPVHWAKFWAGVAVPCAGSVAWAASGDTPRIMTSCLRCQRRYTALQATMVITSQTNAGM